MTTRKVGKESLCHTWRAHEGGVHGWLPEPHKAMLHFFRQHGLGDWERSAIVLAKRASV
jgi:hypothetical protein